MACMLAIKCVSYLGAAAGSAVVNDTRGGDKDGGSDDTDICSQENIVFVSARNFILTFVPYQ